MSFNNKNFWMSKNAGCLTDGKVCLGASSKEEHKCHHHWDAAEEEFLSSKKQAVESIENRPIPRTTNTNISLWGNSSSSGSCQFNDPDFVPDPIRTIDLAGKDVSSSGTGHVNIQRNGLLGQFENDSTVNLSMSHTLKDPLNLNGEIGKGSGAGVRNSMNDFSISIGQPHDIRDNNKILSCSTNQTNSNRLPFQPAYGEEDHNSISLGPSFNKADDNFILMGQTLGKGGGEFMIKGHQYHRVNDNMLSMLQTFEKGGCGFLPLDQQYGDSNNNFFPDGPAYTKEHENFILMGPSYGKLSENFKSMAPTFDKRDALITSINQTHYKEDASSISMGITFDPGNSNILSMGQNYDVCESTIISFGNEANSSSGGVISGSDILISQSSVQVTEATPQKESIETNANQITKVTSTSKNYGVSQSKEQKKGTANNFPANVKSMLSTGIFDGVPVKYVSWSREKSLRGVIRGSGYLCGCDDCKFSKVLNAYEFERHTGCKTKHPNNHIYFENGKTVYSVVQELKSTTQEVLFEVIQNVTGSPINLKNFRAWRVSYQAASRELERIYGKDETVVQS